MPKVSIFSTVKETIPATSIELDDILENIEAGVWATEVERVQKADSKAERTALKKKVLAFTGSGEFAKRNKANLTRHSGFLIIDLDNMDPNEIKDAIKGRRDPFVRAAFTSISGEGLAIVFRIDPKRHEDSFAAICDYLRGEYGVEEIDEQCKDVTRLRFVSSDPHIYNNPDAEEFPLLEVSSPLERKKRGLIARKKDKPEDYTPSRIKHIIRTNMQKATEGQRHSFRLRNSRLAGGFVAGGMVELDEVREVLIEELESRGVTGEALKNETKTIDDGLKFGAKTPVTPKNVVKKIHEMEEHSEKMRSLYRDAFKMLREGNENPLELAGHIAKKLELDVDEVERVLASVYEENEELFGFNELPPVHKMHRHLTGKYAFRRNTVTNLVVCRAKGSSGKWREVNEDGLFIELKMKGINVAMNVLTSWLGSPEIEDFDPFLDYFKRLPSLPKGVSVIDRLAGFVKTDSSEYWRAMFKKALVRQVRCVLSDNFVNRIVIVLMSEKQGTGKSSFIRWLSPFPGGEYYREDAMTFDKDTSFAMSETMIYNLDELSVLGKRDITQLKAWISKSKIRERRPYARRATQMPRRCTFWGSTNDDSFLTDRENTRWLVFRVEEIDFSYIEEFDIDSVYSEAYALHLGDFDPELTQSEKVLQEERNKGFETVTFEESALLQMFRPVESEAEGDFWSIADVIDRLTNYEGGVRQINRAAFNAAISKLGYIRARKKINGIQQRGIVARFLDRPTVQNDDGAKPIF